MICLQKIFVSLEDFKLRFFHDFSELPSQVVHWQRCVLHWLQPAKVVKTQIHDIYCYKCQRIFRQVSCFMNVVLLDKLIPVRRSVRSATYNIQRFPL